MAENASAAEGGFTPMKPWAICLMAVGAGTGVANVYYIQPLVPAIQSTFDATPGQTSFIPAVSQLGYAAGMLLLAPLGDLVSRKRLITVKCLLLTMTLIATAVAWNVETLLIAGLMMGILASVGQDFIPMAAQSAPPERRGRTIGFVTSGLLCGVLLSRTIGGVIGEAFGWRVMYGIAAVMVALLGVSVSGLLPYQSPATSGSYTGLLRSLGSLIYSEAALRKSLVTQALLAATLGAFWSTLALMLAQPPFSLNAAAAGAFGLAGAAGAAGASLFGSLADSRGPVSVIRIGCLFVVAAFGLLLWFPASIFALGCGAVLFDLGVMAALVSHQTIVTSIDVNARSRLNGLLITAAMIGVSLGALIGGWAWNALGWAGVCQASMVAGVLALLNSFLPPSYPTVTRSVEE